MKTLIIIPAHNEEEHIGQCLDSFIAQIRKPDFLLVVDDNSTDGTAQIAEEYARKHHWIQVVQMNSMAEHQPGAKVVRAFNFGLSQIDRDFEYIGKFDADIILPVNYFEQVLLEFERNPQIGLCSGLLYISKGAEWVYEPIANKTHVRGPVKLYRKSCLDAMKGLRQGIGWDTADVLLARYHGYDVRTLPELHVKHLRPTAAAYSGKASILHGRAYYGLRYGVLIAFLASLKMSKNKRSFPVIWQSMRGYFLASKEKSLPLVTKNEGRFIRRYRWRNIWTSLFSSSNS